MTRDPYNFEAERALLCAGLREPDCLEAAAAIVQPAELSKAHGIAFRRCLEIFQNGGVVDPAILISTLRETGELDECGGAAYICSLTDAGAIGANARVYAEQVHKANVRRQRLEAAQKYAKEIAEGNGDGGTATARLLTNLEKIEKPKAPAGFEPPAHWQLLDVAEVDCWNCPELEWIVQDILAKGNLVFVAGDTQTGKSLMGLYVAHQLLLGGSLFGKFPISPVSRILYLLLEDPPRRAKARILDMRRDRRLEPGRFVVYAAPGLTVNDDVCFAWLREFIAREKFELVFVDTYQKATPGIASFDDVKQGPILHRLSNLTREINVALWVHDHYRKETSGRARKELDLSSLKGTGSKLQNADCYILMERTGNTIKVLVSSKETDKKPRFLLEVSPQGSNEEKFTWAGDLEDAANDMRAKGQANRSRVYDAIGLMWATKSDIKQVTGLSGSTVADHLAALMNDGKIEKMGENRNTRYLRPSGGNDNLFRTVEEIS